MINISNKILVLLSGILLVRILGTSEYGIYSYILSLAFVLIIPIEYGLSNLIVRETAKGIAKDNNEKVVGIWQWSLIITLILFAVILILGTFGILWTKNNITKDEITTYLLALSLIPFQALLMLSSGALRGLKYVILGQLADLIILPVAFIVFFLAYHLFMPSINAKDAMVLRALSTFFAFIVSIIFLFNKTPKVFLKTKPKFNNRSWISSAIPLGLSSGLGMVKTRITILIMALFVNAAQIGTFQVAVSASAIAGLVLQATNSILAPYFASLYVENRKRALQRLVTINTRIVLFFNLVITFLFILFGKFFLLLVFGPDLTQAYPAVLIMLIGQLSNSFVGSVAFLLNMTGFEKDVMKIVGFSTLFNIIITITITPFWGIIGGAISTALSLLCAQIVMAFYVNKRLGIVSHPFPRSHQ